MTYLRASQTASLHDIHPITALQDPMQPGNQANTIMLDARKRKGLKPEPAPLSEYEDKL